MNNQVTHSFFSLQMNLLIFQNRYEFFLKMDVYENRVFGTKIEAVSMQLMTLKFESLKRNDISKKKI